MTGNPSLAQPSEKSRWRVSENLLLLALGVELYLLLYDIPLLRNPPVSDPQNASREAIAELVSKINTVRVQSPGEIIWEETTEGQTLFRSQSVMTLDRSRAEIAFLDGAAFILGENSLVRLERSTVDQGDGERIIVRLDRGTFSKRLPSERSLSLEIGGVLANFQPLSEFTLSRDSAGKNAPRLLIQKGSAELLTSLGKISIREGEEAVLPESVSIAGQVPSPTAPPATRKVELTPISPRAWESVVLADANPVVFQWRVDTEWAEDPKSAEKKQILETAQDPFFSSGVKNIIVPLRLGQASVQASMTLPASMSPALWYWRVRVQGEENTTVTPVEAFWLQGKQAPRIRFPEENVSLALGNSIPLSWAPLEEAVDYEIEVRGSGGTKLQHSADQQLRVEDLPLGNFTWRVRARFKEGHSSPWSEERKFSIIPQPTPAEQLLLPPPPREFLKPEIRPLKKPSSLRLHPKSIWEWIFPSAMAAPLEAEESTWAIELKWKPVPGVTRYKVQVSRSLDFRKIIGEGETETPSWNFNYRAGMENRSGILHYRVASIDPDGQWGNYSKSEKVEIPEEILKKSKSRTPREVYGAYEQTVLEAPSANISKEVVRDGSAFLPAVKTSDPLPRPLPQKKPRNQRWFLSLYTGVGSLAQKSSSANPRSVKMNSLFWRQQFEGSYQSTEDDWSLDLRLGFSSFSKVPQQNGKIPQQSDFSSFEAKIDWISQEIFAEPGPEIRWDFGVTAERAFRFVKDGAQSVKAQGAVSLGPLLQGVRHYSYGSNWGGRLRLPVTGVLTRGFASLEGRLWREWEFFRFKKSVQGVSLRIEAEAAYFRWSEPSSTQVISWSVSAGPRFFF